MFSNSGMRKILFVSANPRDTERLRLDQEMREIQEGLQRAQRREQFQFHSRVATRPRDLRRGLLDVRPAIVHFSGHGAGDQGLGFEDEIGNLQAIDGNALSNLFRLFSEQIECVVLNGCYSEIQAEAIQQVIPYVIGMSREIGDEAAISFSIGFYDALGAGENFESAYAIGRASIGLEVGTHESETPVLLNRNRITEFDNIDYLFAQVDQFLQNQQWQEADAETARLMILLSGDRTETEFCIDRLDTFPCESLLEIDQLWRQHSSDMFGFSIQRDIWSRSMRDFLRFSRNVGWYIDNSWLSASDYEYGSEMPRGHLPSLLWVHIQGWGIGKPYSHHSIHRLLEKFSSCLLAESS